MLSFQEIESKAAKGIRDVAKALDGVNGDHGWCPEDASIYDGMSRADALQLKETLDSVSLAELLKMLCTKETLIKGATGPGADALVAAKLHDTLVFAVKDWDICGKIGYIVPAWEGGDLKVDILKDNGFYSPHKFVGGGKMVEINGNFVQSTITPRAYGVPIMGGEDLIEDSAFGIIQWHVENCSKAIGKHASGLAIKTLITGTGGDGTVNTSNADSGETKWIGGTPGTSDVLAMYRACSVDQFKPDTVLCTGEAWAHSLSTQSGTVGWHPLEPTEGYDATIGPIDVLIYNGPELHATGDGQYDATSMTACKTAVFSRKNALMTGRKRWMEIKNLDTANAIMNSIGGAVVSFRQGCCCLYNDAIGILTET